jgi:Arc/MetJ-type ribon-helix-helix transcriptional regulator
MSLVLDPATEQRLQRHLDRGSYSAPSDVLNRALDLLEADEDDLARRRATIVARLEESCAQADRGEGVTGEELRARLKARKAAFERSEKVAG